MAYLLDVNVLLALSWPAHEFHAKVQRWFAGNAVKGWATCPIVETGFVRIVSNPAFSPHAVSPAEALAALRITLRHPAHQFWADDISVSDGMGNLGIRILGHQQITDAYLLALAMHRRGKVATLDKKLVGLLEGNNERSHVELI
ncbi:MAG TPA: TA system VapC family ribonuclease toxin [Candidatus Sulfotelmatobacter sp.]